MVDIRTPNLAEELGIELTAAQKKLLADVEKVFDSPVMPADLVAGADQDVGTTAKSTVRNIMVTMLIENISKKYKLNPKLPIDDIDVFYMRGIAGATGRRIIVKLIPILRKLGKFIPEKWIQIEKDALVGDVL